MRNCYVTFLASLLSLLISCGPNSQAETRTDLGQSGNAAVATMFANYQKKGHGCNATDLSLPRVMITGFGLFQDVNFNVSGSVIQSMASESFWPANVNLSNAEPARGAAPARGRTLQSDFGGVASSRVLEIDGKRFDVCFITLDVLWDLSAAIILYEAENFRPNFILMTGRGGDTNTVRLEYGSRNDVSHLSGFLWDGSIAEDVTPVSNDILQGSRSIYRTDWDPREIKKHGDIFLPINFRTRAETAARESNTYVCNNVTYVVLAAMHGQTVELAGRNVRLSSSLTNTGSAFLHFPTQIALDAESIFDWARYVAGLIEPVSQIGRKQYDQDQL